MANWLPPETGADEDQAEPRLFARRRAAADTELDISPMIDCVFLLLIFFIVTSVPEAQTALELAAARHGVGVQPRDSLIVSLADSGDSGPAAIYLADGKQGDPLAGSAEQQDALIRQAVEDARSNGKAIVLIKAEKGVLHRDVARVATAASAVEGIQLNLAVIEAE